MTNIEIEKKIILKGVPNIEFDEILKITQYYFKNKEGIWERYRKSENRDGEISYVRTIKTSIKESKGGCIEDEIEVSKNKYKEIKALCKSGEVESRRISKIRHVKYTDVYEPTWGTNLKWEIDQFIDINITICEIEIPSDDYEVTYPDYISNNIIKDVTGIKEFNNRRMAEILFSKSTVATI